MIDTSTFRRIALERGDGIAAIVLANPEKRNALSLETMRELIAALQEIGTDRSVKVAILRALGPVFSSGHDLRELHCATGITDEEATRVEEIFDVCVALMTELQSIPQPVIAEVAGIATAAGCQLVAACDLAIASLDAKFATPGVKTGLFCSTPMVAVTRAVGRKRAMELLLTGEFIDAATAAEWGLINRVVADIDFGHLFQVPPQQAARAASIARSSPSRSTSKSANNPRKRAFPLALSARYALPSPAIDERVPASPPRPLRLAAIAERTRGSSRGGRSGSIAPRSSRRMKSRQVAAIPPTAR